MCGEESKKCQGDIPNVKLKKYSLKEIYLICYILYPIKIITKLIINI